MVRRSERRLADEMLIWGGALPQAGVIWKCVAPCWTVSACPCYADGSARDDKDTDSG